MNKILKAIYLVLHFPIDVYQMFVTYLPGRLGNQLRYLFWKGRLKHLGNKVIIDVNTYFQNPEYITLDDHCWIDRNVIIVAGTPNEDRIIYDKENPNFPLQKGEVYIGANTHIAPNCILSGIGGLFIGRNSGVAANSAIYSFSHHYRNLVDRSDDTQYNFSPLVRGDHQAMIRGPVFIDDYCGLGFNTFVLPGVTLKRGTWVASGTTVSDSSECQTLIFSKRENGVKSLSDLKIKI